MIKLKGVNKVYKSKKLSFQALYDVSLEISQGELVAVMGRSGCGKTTLLNILGFMDHMDGGSYTFKGQDAGGITGTKASLVRNQNIGFVYQGFNLVTELNALENVEMPLGYAGVPAKRRQERAKDILDRVGLGDKLHSRPGELSGGQKQRVAIARALVNHPGLILADEPTGNLDKKSGDEIMALLRELNREGTTIVIVTHDPAVAQSAGRVIRLEDGRVIL